MKILMIMQWCTPEPDFKCIPMAKALQALGHEIEVLTGFPNYPGGKIYPGYRIKLVQREIVEGIRVIRVPLFPSHGNSGCGRILNYLSFAISSSLIGPFVTLRPDVVYVYNPMGLTGIVFKLLKKSPYVYDVQDIWPDSINLSGILSLPPQFLRLLDWYFRRIYHSASKIIVQSNGFKSILEQRGVPSSKIHVIYNWTNEHVLPPSKVTHYRPTDKLRIFYTGNMGAPQALTTVIQAAENLSKSSPHISFTFIGSGSEVEQLKSQSIGLSNTFFLPQVPQRELVSYLSDADVLLVHLKNDPLFSITIPSKISFYLALGKPILAGVSGETSELVMNSAGGFTFDPEDPMSLVSQILYIDSLPVSKLQLIGITGQSFYFNNLSLKSASLQFESILLTTLSPNINVRPT